MLRIRDVEGPKKTGSMETRLEAMEQQVFKCQGMVERGLNANHMMITEFTSNHKMDAIDIGKHLSRLYDRVDQLQGQVYDLQSQNWNSKREQATGNSSLETSVQRTVLNSVQLSDVDSNSNNNKQ
ncbi:40S ribosomal protein S5-1 [Hordeum vulgare]|nr:40S ribosomal protein S5-1 [Hordeum vulgare]